MQRISGIRRIRPVTDLMFQLSNGKLIKATFEQNFVYLVTQI
jgi:hypothetical protein